MAEIEENNFKIGRDFSLLSSLSKSPKSPPAEYPELRPFIQSKEALRDLIGREDSQKSLPSPEDDLSMSAFREDAEIIMDEIFDAGKLIKHELIEGIDHLTAPEDFEADYSWTDGLCGLVSAVAFLVDFASDVFLSSAMEDDPLAEYWSKATLLLALIPILIQNLFSIYWYWFDEISQANRRRSRYRKRPVVWLVRVLFHVTLLAPVLRQLDIIFYGMKSSSQSKSFLLSSDPLRASEKATSTFAKEEEEISETGKGKQMLSERKVSGRSSDYRNLWLHAEGDSAALDFIGTLLQDTPQVILQLYVMTKTFPSFSTQLSYTIIVQFGSVSISFITMAWTITGFVRAVRLPSSGLRSLSPLETVVLTLAHFTSIAPQVSCIALLASNHLLLCLVLVAVHWLVSSAVVAFKLLWQRDTNVRRAIFSHDVRRGSFAWLDDVAFSAAFGIAFLLTFMDVTGEASLRHSVAFCCFKLAEEIVFLIIWITSTNISSMGHWILFLLLPIFFLLSLLFFVLFYKMIGKDSTKKQKK